VLHRQQAINHESGSIMDMTKRQKTKKATVLDELAREDNFSMEARVILQNLAIEFVGACFNRTLFCVYSNITRRY
jgi:replication fork protection complex subunit Tof1/Swi1